MPAVSSYRSARVVNDTHAPRWDSIHSPRNPDLPTRGGAMIAVWCSCGANTRLKYCARPSRQAYHVTGQTSRAPNPRSGRTRRPWTTAASRDQRNASSPNEANPGAGLHRNRIRHRARRDGSDENSVAAREHRHGEHQDHQDEEPHRRASSSSCRAASIASEIASAARIAAA